MRNRGVVMMNAIEHILEKGKRIGGGWEGEVYKITPNVVAKIWRSDAFEEVLKETLLKARFSKLKMKLKEGHYPQWVKTPEFLGIETCYDNIITYHQYISRSREVTTFERKLPHKFYEDFCDAHRGNYIATKKALYLVDVIACRKR